MAQCFARLVSLNYFQNKQEGEQTVNGDFVHTFTEDVLKDSVQDLYYILMPASTIALPRDKGIHQISLTQGQKKSFKRVSQSRSLLMELASLIELDLASFEESC